VDQLFGATDYSHVTGGQVTFAPGARSNWPPIRRSNADHHLGYRLGAAGSGDKQVIRPGDVTPSRAPGVRHWHGATRLRCGTSPFRTWSTEKMSIGWSQSPTNNMESSHSPHPFPSSVGFGRRVGVGRQSSAPPERWSAPVRNGIAREVDEGRIQSSGGTTSARRLKCKLASLETAAIEYRHRPGLHGMNHNRGPAPDRTEMIASSCGGRAAPLSSTRRRSMAHSSTRNLWAKRWSRSGGCLIATKFGHDLSPGGSGASTAAPNTSGMSPRPAEAVAVDSIDLFTAPCRPNVPIEMSQPSQDLIARARSTLRPVRSSAQTIRRAHRCSRWRPPERIFLWWREPESEVLRSARVGIGFVPYSPLGRGFLTANR